MANTIPIPFDCLWDYCLDDGSWVFYTAFETGNLQLGHVHPISNSKTAFYAYCALDRQWAEDFESVEDAKEWIEARVRNCVKKE